MSAQPMTFEEGPLSVQERLKDMQSMLVLQGIRAVHDENPTVLAAIDHAIRLIKERIEKRKDDLAPVAALRSALTSCERGEAVIFDFGWSRDEAGDLVQVFNIVTHQQHLHK